MTCCGVCCLRSCVWSTSSHMHKAMKTRLYLNTSKSCCAEVRKDLRWGIGDVINLLRRCLEQPLHRGSGTRRLGGGMRKYSKVKWDKQRGEVKAYYESWRWRLRKEETTNRDIKLKRTCRRTEGERVFWRWEEYLEEELMNGGKWGGADEGKRITKTREESETLQFFAASTFVPH